MDDPPGGRTLSRGAAAHEAIPARLDATLLLVRHGQSTFVAESRFQGRLDPPLSTRGEDQARRLGDWLARPGGPPGLDFSGPPCEIVHSPLERVARTADIVARAIGRTFDLDPAALLRSEPRLEEIGVGAWEGLTLAEVERRWGPLHAAWRENAVSNTPPRGEPLAEAAQRVNGALPAILERLGEPGASTAASGPAATASGATRPWSIVAAHGGILRLLLFTLLDLPLARFWAFPFALASVSVIDLRGGRASLRAHNLAEHLAGPGAGPENEGGAATRIF